MLAREGELIENENGIIFDVKGLMHPPKKIIAFPRFIPSIEGKRKRNKKKYDKIYNLSERYDYLKNNAPNLLSYDPIFDETLCEVPIQEIKRHYNPINKLKELRKSKKLLDLEKKAIDLLRILKNKAKIPWNSIGISGSILVGLYKLNSDLDPIIYGKKNCQKAYKTLEKILEINNTEIKAYNREGLKNLYKFRKKDTQMEFEDFYKVESRKAFQGTFGGTDFFIRFVRNWEEIKLSYGDIKFQNCGEAKILAKITNDSEALFTPCKYLIGNIEVLKGKKSIKPTEIASFRGRFCLQAKESEKIIAQGKLEKVINNVNKKSYYRLILGSKPTDFMILS